ncbi:MAG TPA: hypothetical protein VFG59_12095 [Anaeromyxobacter sp.]|nr:hypothetical protein [Anaeromyxobacter sp.]
MAAVLARRLPGLRFEASAPALAEVLPRMDVAAFVGFAASGPLNRPVAVEDEAHLDDLFGSDLTLAWDASRGAPARAHLAPAVRAFFRNGGARCLVVRVAGAAQVNLFPVPGLLRFASGRLRPAFARARSEGSWSDPLRVGTALRATPVQVAGFTADGTALAVVPAPGTAVSAGDLLRVAFPDDGLVLVLPVGADAAPGADLRTLTIPVAGGLWFTPGLAGSPTTPLVSARWFTPGGDERDLPVLDAGPAGDSEGAAVVTLAVRLDAAPPPGTVLRLQGDEETWMQVETLAPVASSAESAAASVEVAGQALRVRPAPSAPPAGDARAERVEFDLSVRRGAAVPLRLLALGFTSAHPRAWEALPADLDLFDEQGEPVAAPIDDVQAALKEEVRYPRFPLSGPGPLPQDEAEFTFPVGALAPTGELGCEAGPADAPERDGLAAFGPEPFLDPDLAGIGTEALLAEADFLRQESPRPRTLRGVHSLLPCDEVTVVAVPDAIHPGWAPGPAPAAPPPAAPSPPPPAPSGFRDCGLEALEAPAFLEAGPADAAGSFPLAWTPAAGVTFTLEEATRPGFEDAYPLHQGPESSVEVLGRAAGTYYYRVQAARGASASAFSNAVSVTVAPPAALVLAPEPPFAPAALLAVQRALLRLCAARGDLLAVLSLPASYGPDQAVDHVARLRAPPTGEPGVQALSYAEQHDLSYGALYHPWVIGAEPDAPALLRREPPDGAACGVLAQRALTRGAWVAPANAPLTGIVDLDPAIPSSRWQDLQDAQVNVIRQEPRGFVVLASDTLALEPDFVPIPARRVLALVRRAALRLGPAYVFEPNDDALRRMVQRGFEDLLGQLYASGAFAGPTASSAYQVVAGSPEVPDAAAQGLFFVELRIAPSSPMRFLTVRLVQGGDGSTVTEAA